MRRKIRNGMRPVHPGEILREEFLVPLRMSGKALAEALHIPPNRINSIVNESRGITADTALQLARYFGTTADFWMNLQKTFELRSTENKVGSKIRKEIERRATSNAA